MKATFILATVALAAAVSAQTTDADLGTNWCKVYTDACTKASATACGPAFTTKNNSCKSLFVNGKCTEYVAGCSCINPSGTVMTGNIPVLTTTFAATGGACSDLERTNVPINNNTVPTTTGTSAGSSPSASGTTPVGTGVPDKGKGNAAGKFATNTFLAVAAAVGAAAFAL